MDGYVKGSVSHHDTHIHTYRCHSSVLCRQWGCRLFTLSFRQAKANVGDQLYAALRNIAKLSPSCPWLLCTPHLAHLVPCTTHTHYTGGPMFKNHRSVDNLTERTTKNTVQARSTCFWCTAGGKCTGICTWEHVDLGSEICKYY